MKISGYIIGRLKNTHTKQGAKKGREGKRGKGKKEKTFLPTKTI